MTDKVSQFQEWLSLPSPTGLWVYRGQAKYSSITPSEFRSDSVLANPMIDCNYEIAEMVMEAIIPKSSLIYYKDRWIEYLSKSLGKEKERSVTFEEYIKALYQHYCFPTMYIDLTFDPYVALSFATHSFEVPESPMANNEDGYVFRWPAVRKDNGKVEIILPGRVEEVTKMSVPIGFRSSSTDQSIECLDLTRQFDFMKRPTNQAALVAKVAITPDYIAIYDYSDRPELGFFDLSKHPDCDVFLINKEASRKLAEASRNKALQLFPNSMDFGYSLMTLLSFLSVSACFKEMTEFNECGVMFIKALLEIERERLDIDVPQFELPAEVDEAKEVCLYILNAMWKKIAQPDNYTELQNSGSFLPSSIHKTITLKCLEILENFHSNDKEIFDEFVDNSNSIPDPFEFDCKRMFKRMDGWMLMCREINLDQRNRMLRSYSDTE